MKITQLYKPNRKIMNWYSALYWFTRLDSIIVFELVFALVLTLAACINLIWWCNVYYEVYDRDRPAVNKRFSKPFKWILSIGLAFWMLFIFTPSKKDAALIVAGGVIGNYIQKDTTIQQIPKEVLEYLRAELKQYTAKAVLETTKNTMQNTVLKDMKEDLIQKMKNSSTEDMLKMLQDSAVQRILKQ